MFYSHAEQRTVGAVTVRFPAWENRSQTEELQAMPDGYTAIFALFALVAIVTFFLVRVSRSMDLRDEEGGDGKNGLFGRVRRRDDFFVVDATGKTILMQAAAQGFEEGIDHVLVKASVAAVNSATDDGTTALHCAIAPGNPAIVSRLLDFGAHPNVADHDGRTPLWLAVHKEDARIAALLLDYKADPNCRVGKNRLTPLMAAAKNGRIEIVNLLLDRGADPRLVSEDGRTAAQFARENFRANMVDQRSQNQKLAAMVLRLEAGFIQLDKD
ncbi:MAG: ankyrin repeat domain-containing protein [Pseudomonadota bacterium]